MACNLLMMRPLLACAALLAAICLIGCATAPKPGGAVRVDAGGYDQAFDRARDSLVDLGFTLNRVDAAAGIITTQPLPGRGLAAPWERQQATLPSRIADAAHTQSRTVRVEFLPVYASDALASDAPRSQIEPGPMPRTLGSTEPVVARVTVLIERLYRPGLRPQVADVVRSRRTYDPSLSGGREFSVVIKRDEPLEDLIAGRIADGR